MNKPMRVQRDSHTSGNLQTKSPDGGPVANVWRNTKWHNEFRVFAEDELFWITDFSGNIWGSSRGYEDYDEACSHAVSLYTIERLFEKVRTGELNPYELHGKHLACVCRLSLPCHADVLLEWANEPHLLWHRYDFLIRKAGEHTPAEKTELAELHDLLADARIVIDNDIF